MIKRDEAKAITKKEIKNNPVYVLRKAVHEYDSPIHLLVSLLFANGFPYVECEKEDAIIRISAGHARSALKERVSFCENTKQLSGPFLEILGKSFSLITAIEHQLSDALLLPYKLRMDRVEEVCKHYSVDRPFFDLVLHNW